MIAGLGNMSISLAIAAVGSALDCGEEGTSNEDFEVYLKGELLDSVFLQQNAFDKVDAATNQDRQQFVFNKVNDVLTTEFPFDNKEDARSFFNRLRQNFIDWNYLDMDSTEFKEQEESIEKLIKEHSGNEKGL